MNIKKVLFTFISALLLFTGAFQSVNAENVCYVKDPTGTLLNVRSAPQGKVINKLKNGFAVDIIDVKYDKRGKQWAKVGGILNGQAGEIGWVYMDYLDCKSLSPQDAGEKACTVADPTGTPLNVRSKPNGKKLSTLKNGENVFIDDTQYIKNKPWYKVGKYVDGRYKTYGWVYGKYLDCD